MLYDADCHANLQLVIRYPYPIRIRGIVENDIRIYPHRRKLPPNSGGGLMALSFPCPPSPPLPSPLFPSPLHPCPPFPSLSLEVGPQIQLGGLGSAVSSPAGSGAEPQPKSNLVHFSLKIRHLVATI